MTIILVILGFCFGMVVSGGVFSVVVAVGMAPRFAIKTKTSSMVMLYEECIIFGAIFGTVLSVFRQAKIIGEIVRGHIWIQNIINILLGYWGIMAGMFVGCLAIAIAEMLDAIPIFLRRVKMRHGLGICILAIAIGKVFGSIIYFLFEFIRTCH